MFPHYLSYPIYLSYYLLLYLKYLTLSSSFISLRTLQGFPTATTPDGMSFVTTLPEPITVFFPIVTPGLIITHAPIHTLSSIFIGKAYISPSFLQSGSTG